MSILTVPVIPKKDLQFIKKNRIHYSQKPLRIRLNILWLTTKHKNASDIAEYAGCSERHVFHVIEKYMSDGLNGVLEYEKHKKESELKPYSDLIKKDLEDNPLPTAKDIQKRIFDLTGIKKSVNQVISFIKSLGAKHIKPTRVPMGKNETDLKKKAKKQKEYVEDKLTPHIEQHASGKCKLLFMDASHMQVACVVGCIWCFVKQYVPALNIRGRVNVIGAISPNGKDFIYDVSQSSVNQEAIMRFLRKISRAFKGHDIRLVLDNASYHHAHAVEELAAELGITLVFLPVASPNLNIIERLWKFVKSKFLKNKIFTHLDELENILETVLKTLKRKYKKELESLLTTNFQYFDETAQFVLV